MRVFNFAPKIYSLKIGAEETAYKLSDNKILGYELKKNFRSSSPDFHHSYYKTNSFGFRDKKRTLAKVKGRERIILLGDSVTVGQGIKKLENTIPLELEKKLEPNFEVLNFGLTGYCTYGEIELLKTKGLEFKPDRVIVLFTDNDFIESNASLIDQIVEPKSANRLKILRMSALFRAAENFYRSSSIISKFSIDANEQKVKRGLTELVELSKKYNFKPLVAIWPSFDDTRVFYKKDQYLNQDPKNELRIERISKNLKIPTIKLDSAFKKHLISAQKKIKNKRISPNWSYTIGDNMHPNKLGAKIAAEYLAEKLMENNIS